MQVNTWSSLGIVHTTSDVLKNKPSLYYKAFVTAQTWESAMLMLYIMLIHRTKWVLTVPLPTTLKKHKITIFFYLSPN